MSLLKILYQSKLIWNNKMVCKYFQYFFSIIYFQYLIREHLRLCSSYLYFIGVWFKIWWPHVLPDPGRRSPHGVYPGSDGSYVHALRELDPRGAMVALHQVHQVQQQHESDGDVSVAHIAWRLPNCALYGVPEKQETMSG